MEARLPWAQEAAGSNPVSPTKSAVVAQLVEHWPSKPVVAGSSPVDRSRGFLVWVRL